MQVCSTHLWHSAQMVKGDNFENLNHVETATFICRSKLKKRLFAGNLISQWKESKPGATPVGGHSWEYSIHTLNRTYLTVNPEHMLLLNEIHSWTVSKEAPHQAFYSSNAFSSCMVIKLVMCNKLKLSLHITPIPVFITAVRIAYTFILLYFHKQYVIQISRNLADGGLMLWGCFITIILGFV